MLYNMQRFQVINHLICLDMVNRFESIPLAISFWRVNCFVQLLASFPPGIGTASQESLENDYQDTRNFRVGSKHEYHDLIGT